MGVDLTAEDESYNRARINRIMPRSSYYENFNSSIVGEHIKTMDDNLVIPSQYLNVYEKNFDKELNKQKLISVLAEMQ